MRDYIKPKMKVAKTAALAIDPGITYNESGVIFDSDYQFGGVYNLSDGIKPRIVYFTDFQGSSISPPTPGDGLTGEPMGLLLTLLYP